MIFNEKSYGFWIAIVGIIVLLGISLMAVFRYSGVTDASGVITAAGTVIGTLLDHLAVLTAPFLPRARVSKVVPTVRTHLSVDPPVRVKSEREKSVAVDRVLLVCSD